MNKQDSANYVEIAIHCAINNITSILQQYFNLNTLNREN